MGRPTAALQASAPARIFYGWYIVAVGFGAMMLSTGVQAYTLGVFIAAMERDTGWSRTALSGVQSLSTLANGLLGPLVGPIIDKRGSRELMLFGAIVSCVALIATALSTELWQFYLFRGVIFTAGTLCLGTLVINTTISNWFVRMRGRAIAISAMGLSIAAIAFPPMLGWILPAWGWRSGWIALALLSLLMIPPTLLVMRRRPEDMGLLPDGDFQKAGEGPSPIKRSDKLSLEESFTRAEAIRTPALWLVVLAFGTCSIGVSAMNLHIVPFLADQGHSQQAAALAISVNGLAGLICKPFWGLAVERIPVRYCAVFEFLTIGIGIGVALVAPNLTIAYLGVFIYGIGNGGMLTVQEVVWGDYFGRRYLGAVRSIGLPFAIISSAGGPLFAGMMYDWTGSYDQAFIVFTVTPLLAAGIIFLARQPKRPAVIPMVES